MEIEERERRQLLIESEFEETQKKGEKEEEEVEERAKIALEIGRRLCQFNRRGERRERYVGDN